ncbi:hypothetical protein ACFSHR_27140 [Azotobacter chroococcum]
MGDTPIISLGEDAEYTIYQPGADLSGNPVSTWWHSATEVGSTSSGTAGLELRATYEVEPVPTATAYLFSGDTITIPAGAGEFPDGWAAGMIARIEAEYPYTVIDGGASRDIIEADFDQLQPFVGMQIEIVGDNAGLYEIESYTPGSPDQITLNYPDGSPVLDLLTGSRLMGIGYAGLRYRLTAASTTAISVERLTDTGGTDPSTWPGFDPLTSYDALISLDASTQEETGPARSPPARPARRRISWSGTCSSPAA